MIFFTVLLFHVVSFDHATPESNSYLSDRLSLTNEKISMNRDVPSRLRKSQYNRDLAPSLSSPYRGVTCTQDSPEYNALFRDHSNLP